MKIIAKEWKELTFIHLQDAVLCANCELIASQTYDGACPACGSKALMSVSRLLGGTVTAAMTNSDSQNSPAKICHSEGKAARFSHRSLFFSHNPSHN